MANLQHPMHGPCVYCQIRPAESRDHIIPKSMGGVCKLGNRAWSCHLCNSAKGSLSVIEWMATTVRYVLTGDGPVWVARWVEATLGGRANAAEAILSGRPILAAVQAGESCDLLVAS